jgi:methionyl aminopeptidase
MIPIKTREEIEMMRQSALIVSRTLGEIAKRIKPGVTTLELDQMAEEMIRDHGAIPAFKGQYDYPYTLCMSLNECVVHGMPNRTPLQEGDIISVDCGAILNGWYGDHAYTFAVGEIDPKVQRLLDVTKESLYKGIEQMVPGNHVGDIGFAIQTHAERNGYGVVRDLVGHGLGKQLHEEPQVPNYGRKGKGAKLSNGMVFAVEPMINMGTHRVKQLKDGWSIVTADKKPAAHFEHDIAIWDDKPMILSTFDYVYEALGLDIKDPASLKA